MARGLAEYLVDRSALARSHHPVVNERLGPLSAGRLVATCGIVDMELLYSARARRDFDEVLAERRAIERVPVDDEVIDRAIEVQQALARSGRHRLPIADLLIAAAAELSDLTVMHYDADFERIARVTGQRHAWISPRGSL